MTNRYAIIDINSGYVWGVTDASDPVNACQRIDHDLGERGRSYDSYATDSGAHRWGMTGYLVHRVDADFDVGDGRDRDMVEAAESFPRVAIVLTKDAEG